MYGAGASVPVPDNEELTLFVEPLPLASREAFI